MTEAATEPSDGESRSTALAPRALARRLSIEPGEELRTGLLFALLFVGSTIFVMGRTARDALFLTRFPVAWVAWMWVGYGVVSSLVALGWGPIAATFSREKLVIGFGGLSALSYVVVRVLVGADVGWAIAFFYVWAEVIANLFILQAWTITNDLHDPRSARRLFGLIGAGRIVGIALSGLATGAVVRLIGTPNLILVIAGLMVVFIALVHAIGVRYPLPKAAVHEEPTAAQLAAESSAPTLRDHTKYAVLLSLMLLAAFIALTVGDYQFKGLAKLAYPDRDAMASYMAGFYAAMGMLALVFQLFITPNILKRLGITPALLTMPACFLSSTASLLGFPGIHAATALKLSDNGLQYTIHDATMQILYFAFPTALRTRVRALLDAMVKPLGYSLGGVLLVVLAPSPLPGEPTASLMTRTAAIGVVSLVLGVVWVAAVPFVRRAYVESLRKSLSRRESDVSDELDLPSDATVRGVLVETLKSGVPAQVVFAMERLADSAPDVLLAELPALLEHRCVEVRAEALRRAASLAPELALERARQMVGAGSEDEFGTALGVIGKLRHEDAVDELAPFLDDDDAPQLRNTAIATLIAHCGLSGVMTGGARLMELSRSERAADREDAARVFGLVGQGAVARSLKPLLGDSSRAVRVAAAWAARQCASKSLTVPLLDRMSERALVKPATAALVAIGEPVLPLVGERLANPETERVARLSLPRVLQSIATPRAFEILMANVGDADEGVRQKVLAAASRVREALHLPPVAPSRLQPLIQRELDDHLALRAAWTRARPWLVRPLVDAQIRTELRANVVRVMRYCELAHSRSDVAAARGSIFSKDSTKRANALEVLDNVLALDNRNAIVAIADEFITACAFDGQPAAPKTPPSEDVQAWFRARITAPGHYRRATLFESVGIHRIKELAPLARPYLVSSNPFMRECALLALTACEVEGWREAAATLAENDDHPLVREYARYVQSQGSAGLDPEDEMYTTVEKILFLQGVQLFVGVSGNDLMPLASSSQVVRLPAGAFVFKEGQPGDSLYVVIHGKVAVTKAGKELALLGPGEVIGEMAILDQAARMADAVVREDADLLRVSAEDFSEVLQETAELAKGVIRVLSRRLRERGDHDKLLTTDEAGRLTLA